jgi:hypothetical protein
MVLGAIPLTFFTGLKRTHLRALLSELLGR